MKILILTQEENIYLPESFAHVCLELKDKICFIVIAPAMSTHGGKIKGIVKHLCLFGFFDTSRIAIITLFNRIKSCLVSKISEKYYSVKNVADHFDIPISKVDSLKSKEFEKILHEVSADLLISISCPLIIGKKIRDRFPMGCINVHGAPLPKYRGLMPAFWMLKNGEKTAGTTVHILDAKLDDGKILLQRTVPIDPEETWDSLVRKTKYEGARLLVEAVRQIEEDTVNYSENSEEEATYFSFPTASDRKEFLASGRKFF